MKNVMKLTFSLTCFVMLIALGFAFTPVVLAAVDTVPEPDLSVTDVSEAHGNQLELYTAIARPADADAIDTQAEINALLTATVITGRDIEFYIRLKKGYALLDDRGADAAISGPHNDPATVPDQRPQLHISDLIIEFYDINGAALDSTIDHADSKIEHRNTSFPDGRNFRVTISAANDLPANARYMTVLLPGPRAADATTTPPTTARENVSFTHADPVDVRQALIDNKDLMWNIDSNALRFELVNAEPAIDDPNVVSIVRVVPTAAVTTSRFTDAAVSGPFNVRVTFTEQPNFAMDGGNIKIADLPFELENAKITAISKGIPFYLTPNAAEGNYSAANPPEDPPAPTGRDARYHPYLVEITPNLFNSDDVVIRVKPFNDLVKPANRYTPPSNLASQLNRSVLRVRVHSGAVRADIFKSNTDALNAAGAGGSGVFLPGGTLIPANGYLVLARGDEAMSGVRTVGAAKYKDNDDRARADNQTDIDFMYNVVHSFAFPAAASDFANLFRNGGSISLGYNDVPDAAADKSKTTGYHGSRSDADLAALDPPETIAAGSVVINEIMWGRNEGLGGGVASANSQWIELHNTTAKDISLDEKEWALTFGGTAFGTEIDSVSNLSPSYWVVPGSSGNTKPSGNQVAVDLVSASRIDATVSGSMADNWTASSNVGTNLSFGHIGTPGAANVFTPIPTAPEPAPEPMAPVATASDLMITEIMVASNGGRLPQWIEITNGSVGEVSLMGWSVGIDNDPADASVVAPSLGIKLDGVTLDAGQSVLVVSKLSNRNSGVAARSKGDDNVGALDSNRIVDAQAQVSPPTATYSLLSEMAFRLSLEPPLPLAGGITARGDIAGNLGGGWDLPMYEGGRSSIIRREMSSTGEIMGTDAAGWVLASDTGSGGAYVATYYGDKDDMGTPGYDAGGALPVELSKFGAKRDPLTGQVIVTWETQSELNNAGFFIKRSQQKNSKFVAVNPTMIVGAGTTSEKQSYTYTDTTAQPNIVYYYQIEDVSLDGQRQTLTRAHRLKGHIGAAGKATTTWGELKTSHTQ